MKDTASTSPLRKLLSSNSSAKVTSSSPASQTSETDFPAPRDRNGVPATAHSAHGNDQFDQHTNGQRTQERTREQHLATRYGQVRKPDSENHPVTTSVTAALRVTEADSDIGAAVDLALTDFESGDDTEPLPGSLQAQVKPKPILSKGDSIPRHSRSTRKSISFNENPQVTVEVPTNNDKEEGIAERYSMEFQGQNGSPLPSPVSYYTTTQQGEYIQEHQQEKPSEPLRTHQFLQHENSGFVEADEFDEGNQEDDKDEFKLHETLLEDELLSNNDSSFDMSSPRSSSHVSDAGPEKISNRSMSHASSAGRSTLQPDVSDVKGSSLESVNGDLRKMTEGDVFRMNLKQTHERLHQELRMEHRKVEHSLETSQRSVLFSAREAFYNQVLAVDLQATKESQARELSWLSGKQKQQIEERAARATIKSMQAEQVKLIKSLQNRIRDLEEIVNIAKNTRIQSRRKREQFSKKINFIEEQQQKERQLLLESQLRSSQIDRKLYEIEIRHLPDWKRQVLLEARKLIEQQRGVYLHRQAEHLREYQLLQLRHMQKIFDAELADQDSKEEILAEQRNELQAMRARHFKEFRAEKERLAAQRSMAKSKMQNEKMEQQIQVYRTQQARQIRNAETTNRRQARLRQKQFEDDERTRDMEFRERLASGNADTMDRKLGSSSRGDTSEDAYSDSNDAKSDISSNTSDNLPMELNFKDSESVNNTLLNAGNKTDEKSSLLEIHDWREMLKHDKQTLTQLSQRHAKEIEDLLSVHREQMDIFNEDNKKRMNALRGAHEDEIKAMKLEQLQELKELERVQKDEQLNAKAANDQTDAVLSGMMDTMVVADHSGIIQIFNQAAQRLFGYSEDEIIGQNVRVLMDNALGQRHQSFIDRYLNTGQTVIINTPGREVYGRHKNGETIPLWLSVSDRDLQGKRIFVACIHDIRSQKEKENEIVAKTKQVKNILESMMEPLVVADQTGAISEINTATCQLFGYTQEELMGKNVRILTGPDISRQHDSFIKRYLDTRKGTVIGTSGREVTGWRKDGTTIPIRLSLSASETTGGKTMFVAVLSDIRIIKERENAIQQQKESFQIILDSLDEPVLVCYKTGIIKQSNAATEKLLGYTASDLIGQNISVLEGEGAQPWTEANFVDLLHRMEEKEKGGLCVHRRSKYGEELVMSVFVSRREINGEDLFIITFADIRDLIAREKEIEAQSQELAAVLDSMLEPLIVSDATGKILNANSAVARIFGYTRDELLGENVALLTGPTLERIHHTFIENYIRTGIGRVVGTTGRNVTGYRKDKTEVPIRLSLSDRVVNGKRVFVAVLSDITAQIQKEKAIAEQVENVRSVLDSMLEPVICASTDGTVTMINKAVSAQLQYTEKDLMGKNVSILTGPSLSKVHDSFISRYISTGKGVVIGTSGREVIAYRKDGTTLDVRLSLSDRIMNGERAFIAVLSPIAKVSSTKASESNLDMLSTILDLIPDSVAIANKDGVIIMVNDALVELFGYSQTEMQGKHASFLVHEDLSREEFSKKYLQMGPEPQNAVGRCKNGSEIEIIMAATIKTSDNGANYIIFINGASD